MGHRVYTDGRVLAYRLASATKETECVHKIRQTHKQADGRKWRGPLRQGLVAN